jgi:hypothetical protein
VVMCLAVLNVVFAALYRADVSIAREHGPMENVQALWLLAGTIVFAVFAFRANEPGRRCFFSGIALFYLTFFLLEFDVRPFKKPLLTLLLNGTGRNVWVGTTWVLMAFWTWRHRHATWRAANMWMRSYSAALLVFAGLFWIAGAVAEKLPLFSRPETFFAEELMEVNASFLMALAAFTARRPFRKSQSIQADDPQTSAAANVRRLTSLP